MAILFTFQLIVLLFSVVIHEVSHGLMAWYLGDDTAERAGRLSLNPLAHLDFMGSFIVPLLLFATTGGKFVFGWAKPVPFNPAKLRNPRRDTALVAAAGPLANLILAILTGVIIRLLAGMGGIAAPIIPYLNIIVVLNLVLAVFNLVPIPPLDGSKILFYLFPSVKLELWLNRYGLLLLLLFLFVGFSWIWPIVSILFRLITGIPLT